jgi:hypothetical protein
MRHFASAALVLVVTLVVIPMLAACSVIVLRHPAPQLQSLGNHMPACLFFCEQAASPTKAEGGSATGATVTQSETTIKQPDKKASQ